MNGRPIAKAQVFAGALCVFLGLLLVSGAWPAYLHHTLVWAKTWMSPIQAAVAGSFCLLIGGYILVDAIIKKMR
jgi:hypothetical protein